jgi:hypothetical protein
MLINYDEEVECAVCMRKIEDDDETRDLRCDHLFHISCLDRWLAHHHTTSPLCHNDLASLPQNFCPFFDIQTHPFFDIQTRGDFLYDCHFSENMVIT